MDQYIVYVLYSPTHSKKYIGFTSNLIERMKSHNSLGKKGFTKRYRPWIVVHLEYDKTKREAMDRERFLKSGQGRQWIKDVIRFDYDH